MIRKQSFSKCLQLISKVEDMFNREDEDDDYDDIDVEKLRNDILDDKKR